MLVFGMAATGKTFIMPVTVSEPPWLPVSRILDATLFESGPEQGQLRIFMNQHRQLGETFQETH
jgi:hypothetical protein